MARYARRHREITMQTTEVMDNQFVVKKEGYPTYYVQLIGEDWVVSGSLDNSPIVVTLYSFKTWDNAMYFVDAALRPTDIA